VTNISAVPVFTNHPSRSIYVPTVGTATTTGVVEVVKIYGVSTGVTSSVKQKTRPFFTATSYGVGVLVTVGVMVWVYEWAGVCVLVKVGVYVDVGNTTICDPSVLCLAGAQTGVNVLVSFTRTYTWFARGSWTAEDMTNVPSSIPSVKSNRMKMDFFIVVLPKIKRAPLLAEKGPRFVASGG